MNLSSIIGAPVISIFDNRIIGTIFSFQLNKTHTKIAHFLLEGIDEKVYLLPSIKIFAIQDAVLIKNSTALSVVADNSPPTIVNTLVIDLEGKILGKVVDIELTKFQQIRSLYTKSTQFYPHQILACNYNVTILKTDNTTLNHFRPRSTIPKNAINNVSILR